MKLKLLSGRLKVNLLLIPVAVIMAVLQGATAVLAFFGALALHEGAHAIMAAALGVRVEALVLQPFGCTARMESFVAVSPGKEAAMAAAGPAANMAAAAGCWAFAGAVASGPFLEAFLSANLALAAINLLPALPLDGGRILAALLCCAMRADRATRLCGGLGIFFSAVMLLLGAAAVLMGQINPTVFLMGG
ncbi:MAG: hypothetical protein IJP03_01310, partial [Christensenellaceae bacterium]|nr:hypothetical protein [Christensenellaceae bacterium]